MSMLWIKASTLFFIDTSTWKEKNDKKCVRWSVVIGKSCVLEQILLNCSENF